MNYVVMDEIDNYEYNTVDNSKNNSRHNYSKRKILIIVSMFLLILALICIFLITGNSIDYDIIEKQMILEAKSYVNINNLNTKNGLYIPVEKLSNIKLNNDCNDISGVIIESNLYYPNLVCNNYKSDIINNEEKYGKLIGDELIIVDSNYEYHDLGVDSKYNVELVTNFINIEGVYTYLYKLKENNTIVETLSRKVIVLDNKKNSNKNPKITLKGEEIVYLTIGDIYKEQGILATDIKDGDISSKVSILDSVNYNQVGEYEIKYNVTNSLGYSSSITRKIIIGEKSDTDKIVINSIFTPVGVTNDSVKIIILVKGDDYKHTLLPNGEIVDKTLIEYNVLENDTYNFLIYDKDDNITTKQIDINNIDKQLPNGVCKAKIYKNYIDVEVSNINKELCVFNYETNTYSSLYMSDKEYKIPVNDANIVNVNIKDVAGNINKINCTIEKDISVINKEYINEKGYHCIEPYTCLKQGDYWREDYCYYSTETCGTISKRGCSITSVATVLSKWDKRSSNGEIFTPYTLMDEVDVYRNCSSCSGTTTTRRLFESFGLQVVRNPENNEDWFSMNMKNHDILLNHLKTGNPAIIRVSSDNGGWYTDGAHIMSLLTANEEGLVYLYDTGTKTSKKNSWGHPVNTFVPLTDVINHCGSSCSFQLIKE